MAIMAGVPTAATQLRVRISLVPKPYASAVSKRFTPLAMQARSAASAFGSSFLSKGQLSVPMPMLDTSSVPILVLSMSARMFMLQKIPLVCLEGPNRDMDGTKLAFDAENSTFLSKQPVAKLRTQDGRNDSKMMFMSIVAELA